MKLLARYQETDFGMSIELRDIETGELAHIEDLALTGLMTRARQWAAGAGHVISEVDFSGLSNGEHLPPPGSEGREEFRELTEAGRAYLA